MSGVAAAGDAPRPRTTVRFEMGRVQVLETARQLAEIEQTIAGTADEHGADDAAAADGAADER